MIVGFTGSQDGMTLAQHGRVATLLHKLGATELHHGNCVGADEQAAVMCRGAGIKTVSHPGDNPDKQSDFQSDVTLPIKLNLDRNKDIVNHCDILIATPDGPHRMRSGTWATIRYASKVNKPIRIIMPNGTVHERIPPD